jgi:probable HAF family extracellular repeat protein
LLALLWHVPSVHADAIVFNVVDLGVPSGFTTTLSQGINSAGAVTGTAMNSGEAARLAFVAQAGSIVTLGTLGGTISQGFGINDSGMVSGSATIPNDADFRGFISNGTTLTEIGTLGEGGGGANGVNNAGQVTGSSYLLPQSRNFHAFIADDTGVLDIGTLNGVGNSTGVDINNRSEVVGTSSVTFDPATTFGTSHAFLYSAGAMQDLGTLGGISSNGWALNDLGQVVGDSTLTTGERHPFLYENGVMQDLGTLGGHAAQAFDINDAGMVVGLSYLSGNFTTPVGFLYYDGSMRNLNDLSTLDVGWIITQATGINESGQIAATACLNPQLCHAVRLDPIGATVPEPTTLALLACGLLGLPFSRRHTS